MLYVTRIQILILVSALVFGVFFRVLLPSSDEPDYFIRVDTVFRSDFKDWSPYIIVPDNKVSPLMDSACEITALVPGLYYDVGSQDVSTIAYRCMVFAIHILVIGASLSLIARRPKNNDHFVGNKLHIDATYISILMPAYLYYVSAFSFETWALIFSTLAGLLLHRPLLYLILALYIYLFDSGNALLLLSFFAFRFSLISIHKNIGGKATILTLFSLVTVLYFIGTYLIQNIGGLAQFSSELVSLSSAYNSDRGLEIISKYPLIARPFITFLTFCFMTPAQIFFSPLTVLMGYFFFKEIRYSKWYLKTGFRRGPQPERQMYLEFYCALSFIISFIFVVPGYASAKYYIFLAPFLISPIICRLGVRKPFVFFSISNLVLIQMFIITKI